MKALVTGGAGFIGSHLVETLLERGDTVLVVDDLSSGDIKNIIHLPCTFWNADITDVDALDDVFREFKPDVVYHLAAHKRAGSANRLEKNLLVNIAGTMNVLWACTLNDTKRIVYASSGSVYGSSPMPITEESPCQPLTNYGVNKLAAEEYVKWASRTHGLDYIILRYFHVYGPRQRDADNAGGVVGIFCRRSILGHSLLVFGDGKQERLFTYVKDVARETAHAGAAEQKNFTYNVASNQPVSIIDLADTIMRMGDAKCLRFIDAQSGDVKHWNVTSTYYRQMSNEQWTPFAEGLIKTFKWYAEKYQCAF